MSLCLREKLYQVNSLTSKQAVFIELKEGKLPDHRHRQAHTHTHTLYFDIIHPPSPDLSKLRPAGQIRLLNSIPHSKLNPELQKKLWLGGELKIWTTRANCPLKYSQLWYIYTHQPLTEQRHSLSCRLWRYRAVQRFTARHCHLCSFFSRQHWEYVTMKVLRWVIWGTLTGCSTKVCDIQWDAAK